jgi:hypothetical protein
MRLLREPDSPLTETALVAPDSGSGKFNYWNFLTLEENPLPKLSIRFIKTKENKNDDLE